MPVEIRKPPFKFTASRQTYWMHFPLCLISPFPRLTPLRNGHLRDDFADSPCTLSYWRRDIKVARRFYHCEKWPGRPRAIFVCILGSVFHQDLLVEPCHILQLFNHRHTCYDPAPPLNLCQQCVRAAAFRSLPPL